MQKIRIFFNSIKNSFVGVFRNFSLSLASISCISITLILVAISVILSYNVNNFTKFIEKDVTIVAFLDRKINDEQIKQVETKLHTLDNIESIKFESNETIKENMQKESDIFNSILSEYDKENNPLQNTFLIKVKDIDGIGKTANEIKEIESVSLVKYGEGLVEELVKVFDVVKNITIVVVIALILVTAFLISNTIKITIQTRRKHIEIMRLVGASNSFIKLPFFFEGMILGTLGSILPILLCGYGYVYLYNKLGGVFFTPIMKLVNPDMIMLNIILIVLTIGIVVGAIGSYRAVKKYLKI